MSDKPQPARILSAEEVAHELTGEFFKAQEIAAPVQAVKVVAKAFKQAGQVALAARCPRCTKLIALSGEGKHLCSQCNLWMEFVREA